MNRYLHIFYISFLFVIVSCMVACGPEQNSQLNGEYNVQQKNGLKKDAIRQKQLFTDNWSFNLGDPLGAENIDFNDSSWRILNVPHDWSIEGEYEESNPAGIAGAFLPGGIAWYRKSLNWNPAWENKKVSLTFDGIYMNGTIFLNGEELNHQPYGYTGVNVELSDKLKRGENVIAVRVDHSKMPSGRWYTGSGIYRDVWLEVKSAASVVHNGSYVRATDVTSSAAKLHARHEIKNDEIKSINPTLKLSLLSEKGIIVAETSEVVEIPAGAIFTHDAELRVKNPDLWSPDTPSLYTAVYEIIENGRLIDRYETRTGFRSLEFNITDGFVLNGQKMIIKGMCMHHDGGAVGAVVPKDVWRRRFKLLKEAGVNAVRTAHNPFAPEFYDLADEMGLMVMNEAFDGWEQEKAQYDYGLYFEDWWQKDLTSFVKRDRNHPSIIMWSVGNEVIKKTAETQKKLVDVVRELDPTRPITQARGYDLPYADIAGFNGHGEYVDALEAYHAENPDRLLIGTEITHTLHTRDVYKSKTEYRTRDNPAPWELNNKTFPPAAQWKRHQERGVHHVADFTDTEVWPEVSKSYASSFDNNLVRMPIREEIKAARDLPYMLGTFRWTAFDYLGEAKYWPERTMNFGIIDLAGLKKGAYYLYQSQWSDEPMVNVQPHWTHPGKTGVIMPVVAYSNLSEIELFVNGKSAGSQKVTDDMQVVWKVPYEPGTIKVVATGENGIAKTMVRKTAKDATKVVLRSDRDSMPADKRSVAHIEINLTDNNGVYNPHADNLVTVEVSGGGRLIGLENGDVLDLTSTKDNKRKAFHGKLMALIQSNGDDDNVEVSVKSDGLIAGNLNIGVSKP